MPELLGLTLSRATPRAFVVACRLIPGPRTTTRARATALPRFRTVIVSVVRLPAVSESGLTLTVSQAAGPAVGGARTPSSGVAGGEGCGAGGGGGGAGGEGGGGGGAGGEGGGGGGAGGEGGGGDGGETPQPPTAGS